jgi:arylsulfatase A-like enzyme
MGQTLRLRGLAVAMSMVAAAAIGAASHAPQPRDSAPNIILIIADDLGYGDLGVYGAADTKTPNLDRLAREGTRFTDFYANAAVCTPTRAGLITGRYQQRVMLERPISTVGPTAGGRLPVTGRSLPQLLADAGYTTGLIGKWHLGSDPAAGPRAHGFGYFWGYLSGYLDWYTHVRGDGQADLWENETPATHDGYFHHETTRRAVRFLEQHKSERFFLDLSYGAPHWPFQSPRTPSIAVRRNDSMMQHPSDDNAPTRADYVAIVEDFDREIGAVLDAVKAQGLEQNTVVVFTSDNGGEWLSRNAPFFHRKDTLWEGGIRVPAIVRWPGVVPAGRVIPQVGITMDLTATFLGLAGVRRPDLKLEGMDLMPALTRGTKTERTLYWRVYRQPDLKQRAVRQGDYKFLEDGGLRLLYNVRADPGERDDLARHDPARVKAMRALLDAWEKDVDGEADRARGERQDAGPR